MEREKEIGKKAATLLRGSLQGEVSTRFGGHLSGGKASLQAATAVARMRYSKRADGTKQAYLKGIAIKMPRHGFIQHYGIESSRVRAGGTRTREKPKQTTYFFRAHLYSKGIKEKPFIDEAIEASEAVAYLAEELPKQRGEELLIFIKQQLEKQ